MAKIRKINFNRVGKDEGCLCDKCGQYIRNIWTVQYSDGITANFGIDCFEKLNKESSLTAFGQKEFKKALKRIQDHSELYEREKALTEETDIAWQNHQTVRDWEDKSYWFGKPWSEYHEWRLAEFFKARFEEDQKQLARFNKVNFTR